MASTGPVAPPLVNYGTVESPFLIGMMICCTLYGITCAQTVFYYRTYHSDTLLAKYLVGLLFILETVHLMLVGEASHYFYVICKIPEELLGMFLVRTTFAVSFALTVILTNLVQAFYAYRVWTLSKAQKSRIPVVGIVVVTSFVHFCLGVASDTLLYIHPQLTFVHGRVVVGLYSSQLAVAMFCDISISAALVVYLHQSRSGFKATGNMIDRLIIYSINVGVLTSAVSICTFVTFHALPSSTMFTLFTEIISKVYVNSLLVTLNSRKTIRKNLGHYSASDSYPLSTTAQFSAEQNKAKNSAVNDVSSTQVAFSSVDSEHRELGKNV